MSRREYKTVAMPQTVKARRRKGKSSAETVAEAVSTVINAQAVKGWEYVGAETVRAMEPKGWFRAPAEVVYTVLVFDREADAAGFDDGMDNFEDEADFAPARRPAPPGAARRQNAPAPPARASQRRAAEVEASSLSETRAAARSRRPEPQAAARRQPDARRERGVSPSLDAEIGRAEAALRGRNGAAPTSPRRNGAAPDDEWENGFASRRDGRMQAEPDDFRLKRPRRG